jgi:methionyl-tRNA formyltransferase
VTIIRLDEQMDHGPIIAQKKIDIPNWPPKASELEEILAKEGANLLADILIKWTSGEVKEIPQDHEKATFTKKIEKEDGLLDLNESPELNFRKIQAFENWPTAYFFAEKNGKKIRIIVKDAEFKDGELKIKRVTPEGKKEMDYGVFLRTQNSGV